MKLGTGEKTYTTLSSAAEVLKDLGVEVRCGERERTEDELKDGWRSSERAGHTSLPQHQWGSVTAIVRLLWLIGQLLPAHRRDRTGSVPSCSSSPPPPHLAADRTGTDPSCSSSPRRRSDRNGPLLLLAENGPLQFLLLSAGSDPL
ncbi:Nucleobase transporter PlUacP [Dissostichus eleginoides]|uniref:Nucleobase transporter PlUacP n=1 Tax=Dissostichus eleginoides TaxID=100907 RepID=A0AAD9B2L4_DISEL|nr:Nucleobase transporter PlUacP [Dissostichus eleginoides]